MKNKKRFSARKKFHAMLKRHKILINLLILAVGLILIVVSMIPSTENVSDILLNLGISILTSGIIALFALLALDEEDIDEVKDFYSDWGIAQIYKTRSEMNSHTAEVLPSVKREYQQIAFGVKSLRDAYDSLFIKKAHKGIKIKFITMHPNSVFLKEREKIENKQEGEIRKTIIDLIDWIKKLQTVSRKNNNIQIKFYDSLPLDFYCKIDDNLYVGPYLYGKESQQTISYRFNSEGRGYEYYTDYFDTLWNSKIMKTLEEVEKELAYVKL